MRRIIFGLLALAFLQPRDTRAQCPPPDQSFWTNGFSSPYGVAVSPNGLVYVADTFNHKIHVFDMDGNFKFQWGSMGTGDGQFSGPVGIAVDSQGNVFVGESDDRIQKFTADGTYLLKWGSNGTGDGQFRLPRGVTVDGSGNVFVVEQTGARVQKFTNNGVFITKWGTSGTGDGQFSVPWGIDADQAGDIYVSETGSHRIQKFSNTGTFLLKWGSNGSGDGQLNNPRGLDVDVAGNLYVVDLNHRVQKFTNTGGYLAKWGTSGAAVGQFNQPMDIACSGAGCLFISEIGNQRVQRQCAIASNVTPWDARDQALVIPGPTPNQDNVTIRVTDPCGAVVVGAQVTVDISDCQLLCVDTPDGLSGVTNGSGQVVLNPRAGGCEDCAVVVKVNGLAMRRYERVVSPDWDGSDADGKVDCADVAWVTNYFATNNYTPCADMDGSGGVGANDALIYSPAIGAQNTNLCPTACTLPPGGMTAWWALDEASGITAGNYSGPFHGNYVGAVSHVPGKVAGAVSLSAGGEYVQTPDYAGANFGTGNFSMDAWIRTSDTETSVRTIIDKRVAGPTGYSLYLSFGRVGVQVADGAGYLNVTSTNHILTDGAWHHVAACINRTGDSHLYVDGLEELVFDVTARSGSVSNNGPVRIGQAYDGSSEPFNGEIDEVELFNLDLAPAGVCAVAHAGSSGKCKPISGVIAEPDGHKTALLQISNNPLLSGSSMLRFNLEVPGPVDLRVFDIAGRLVRNLDPGSLAIGAHDVAWDGTDDRGERLPQGIYLVRLGLPGAIGAETQRIVLLK